MDKKAWLEEKNPYLAFRLLCSSKEMHFHFPKVSYRIQEGIEVLYIQGVVRCFDAIREFLQKGGLVVFIEGNIEKIGAFLELSDFMLEEGIEILLPEEGQYREIAWKHLFLKSQYMGELSSLMRVKETVHMIASDYREGGKTVLKNIQLNLLRTPSCTDGRSLQGSLKGKPIVVCGSGESLCVNLEKLKKVQDKVVILATGSSIPILARAGIRIDFGAFIDPDPPLKSYQEMSSFTFPLFYQNRLSEAIFQLHQGEKIWMGSSGGWMLEDFLYQEIGLPHFPFDSGWTVGCFGVHIAYFLGGSSIILLGLDSSMENNRELQEGEFIKEGRITRKDLYGAVEWLQAFIASSSDAKFIQGFEQLQIPGCQVDLQWDTDLDLSVSTPVAIEGKPLPIDRYAIQKAVTKIHAPQFEKELSLFLSTIASGVDEKGFNLAYTKLECFSIGEPFYEYLVNPLWKIFEPLYVRKLPSTSHFPLAKVQFFQMLCKEVLLDVKLFEDPFSRTLYVEGKIEGEVIRRYANGEVASIESYAGSKPVGRWKMFYETGEIKSEVNFSSGKLHGALSLFHKGGKKREGTFYLGKKEGTHTIYGPQGKVLFDASFEKNIPKGTWKRYSHQGRLIEETSYLEDQRFNRKEYSLDGKLKYEGVFEGDHFIERRFYEEGEEEKREGIWKEGKIVWS